MSGDLAPPVALVLVFVAGGLLALVVSIWVSWAIIRGAVLSALRKHADEQRVAAKRAHEATSIGHP
jgi:fatty acid desaturase